MALGLRTLTPAASPFLPQTTGELGKPQAKQRTTLFSVVRCFEQEFLVVQARHTDKRFLDGLPAQRLLSAYVVVY